MNLPSLLTESIHATEHIQNELLVLNEHRKLMLLKSTVKTDLNAAFYEPALCLILQGGKEVLLGDRSIKFGAGECLVINHEVPVLSRITQASPDQPYIAFLLGIDLAVIRGLREEFGDDLLFPDESRSLELGRASDNLIDALFRILKAAQNQLESLVLFEQLFREVHFRLLQEPFGHTLRHLVQLDSRASRISRAISVIRKQYAEPLSVPELARHAGMSESSFYEHFKVLTNSTPLQYQKELRLMEARRLITSERRSVTSAAIEVGYTSPNQFSRDYKRKFSVSPSDDQRKTS